MGAEVRKINSTFKFHEYIKYLVSWRIQIIFHATLKIFGLYLDVLNIIKTNFCLALSSYTEEHKVLKCGGDRKLWNYLLKMTEFIVKNYFLIKYFLRWILVKCWHLGSCQFLTVLCFLCLFYHCIVSWNNSFSWVFMELQQVESIP